MSRSDHLNAARLDIREEWNHIIAWDSKNVIEVIVRESLKQILGGSQNDHFSYSLVDIIKGLL
jgi:hypothetical protein